MGKRRKLSPIVQALAYARMAALLERLREQGLDTRPPVIKLRKRFRKRGEKLRRLVGQDQVRVFRVSPTEVLVIYSHKYGGMDWREVKITRLEQLNPGDA